MDDKQTAHAMGIDDTYRVERTLARGQGGVTELVSIDGIGPFVRKKIPSQLAQRNVWAALSACTNPRLPHVEATYELPDHFVVVYDYVSGRPLEHVVQQQEKLPERTAAQLICQLCDAVTELHRHGIIHRDITPSNVIVADDGAHLVDFGIARTVAANATHDTKALGTYGFASPEQFGFAQTDARSDVYSLGRLLGYMLTGVYPDDKRYGQLLADPHVVPSQLKSVIDRACSFEPSARIQSADELRRAILGQPAQQNENIARPAIVNVAPQSARKRSKRKAIIIGAISAILIAALIAGMLVLGNVFKTGKQSTPNSSTTSSSHSNTSDAQQMGKNGTNDSNQFNGSANGQTTDGDSTDNTQSDTTENPLKITESGWSADSAGYIHYAVAVKNTSSTLQVEFPAISITGRAKDGSILFAEDNLRAVSFPKQTIYLVGQAGNGPGSETPESVEFSINQRGGTDIRQSHGVVTFTTSNLSVSHDSFSNTLFNGEIEAKNTGYDSILNGAYVTVVLRNKKGDIIYGNVQFIDSIFDGKTHSFSIPIDDCPDYASYEIHASI